MISTKQFVRAILAVGALIFASVSYGQGVTTASIVGTVIDQDGHPVASSPVTVIHEPSGTRVSVMTRANGQFNVSGLRVGGPYTISVTGCPPQHDIYLNLDQSTSLFFASDVLAMDKVIVRSQRLVGPDYPRMSSSFVQRSENIALVPTIRRDIMDVAALDSRVDLIPYTATGEYAIAAQGINARYNSFLVDGIQANDPFGLNNNGFAVLKSPIPLDAIAAYNLDLNPFDVTRSGFTGLLANVVTKSGTNEFRGSAYAYYTGNRLRGANPGKTETDPMKGAHERFQERTFGATVGGPIVKNRLFFFLAYEEFDRDATPTNGQIFVPNPDDVAAVLAAAKAFGYDAGSADPNLSYGTKQRTYLVKLDWNISQFHRATFSYRRIDGHTPAFADYNGNTATSFSNHWYQANRISDNFSLQFNSTWTPDFQTDAGISYSKYNGTNKPNGTPWPEVFVNGIRGTRLDTSSAITNGQLLLGTNYSFQLNELYTRNLNGHLYGEYSLLNHTIKFGADTDRTEYFNNFVQYYYGRYTFANPAAFAAGIASTLRYQQASPGFTIPQSIADYRLTNYGLLLQDYWRVTNNFTITGGLRFDYPYIPEKPIYLPNFESTFGYRNDATGSGNYTVSPRLGFSYTLPDKRKTQIRGGIGLFQGTNPAVWVANAFDTFGGLNTVNVTGPLSFSANPTYVQTLPAPGTPAAVVNTISPDFRAPVTWKGNLAIDHPLPWLGFIATASIDASKVEEGVYLRSMNLRQNGTMPDGRNRYSGNLSSSYSTVIDMANTHKGGSLAYSFMLQRPLKDRWAASLSYTRTYATEVQPLTSTVAATSYNNRAAINPNEQVANQSASLIPDKWVLSLTREFHFFDHAPTRISAVFRAQTGHAYSWVYLNDANGDGTAGNDAFYMPTGPDDPIVTWASAAQRDAFFAFAQNSDLKNYAGRIVPPNRSRNPWQKTIDLHIEQELPVYGPTKVLLFADCLNFANLFKKSWGVSEGLDFATAYPGYNRPVVASALNGSGQYVYSFGSGTTLAGQPVFTDLSRWQVQVGIKFVF